MKRLLMIVGVAVGASGAWAQVPVGQLPQGVAIPGWAVEAIPAGSRRSGVGQLATQGGGIGRLSIGPGYLSSAEFNQFAGRNLVFNGRAFFRVRAPQRYTFLASVQAGIATGGTRDDCEFLMKVGGSTITNGRFSTFRAREARRMERRGHGGGGAALLSGMANLEPGFYEVEFLAGCPNSYDPPQLTVEFSVRDERSAMPRAFAGDELFHVGR